MNPRKSFLINPKFQIGLIIKVLILALVNNFIFFFAIHFFFRDLEGTALKIGLPEKHIFFNFLDSLYGDLFLMVIVASAVSSTLIICFGVFISHKIAGPIHRVCRDLNDMSQAGELNPMRFREGDYFQELGSSVNLLIKTLKK